MKIGIDIRVIGKNRTGDEVYFFNLVKNLSTVDGKNEYYLYTDKNPEEGGNLAEEIKNLKLGRNFEVIYINCPNRFWWNLWALPNHLRKNPVDIFHTQYIAPFWLPKNVKLILTIHDISFNYYPDYIKKSDLILLKTLLPQSIRRADRILTVSQSERKNIIDFYEIPPEKIDFTYNGVDFERFSKHVPEDEKEKIRKKYKLPSKFVLYIGTLQPRKNIPVLIKALKSLNEALVITGNRKAHNYDESIDEQIKKNNLEDKIIFPGWIAEVDKPTVLQIAQCFVFPTLYEGFGIPLVEAMSAGIPVVCSDILVFREVAQDAVLFCDSKNSKQFAENISKILADENLRNNLIKMGIKTAKNYSWQKTAEKTREIYQNV